MSSAVMCDIWIQISSHQADITLRDLSNQLSQIPKEHSIFQDMVVTQSRRTGFCQSKKTDGQMQEKRLCHL